MKAGGNPIFIYCLRFQAVDKFIPHKKNTQRPLCNKEKRLMIMCEEWHPVLHCGAVYKVLSHCFLDCKYRNLLHSVYWKNIVWNINSVMFLKLLCNF